ncbi:MAG: flagellar basal body P-ring formation chaperone FlgA [Bacteroidota bacterium]
MIWGIILGALMIGATLSNPRGLEETLCRAVQMRAQANGEEAVVEGISIPRLPAAMREGQFFLEPLPPGRLVKRVIIMVDFTESANRNRRVPVSCTVRTFGEAYVTTHMMDRHRPLSENDVAVRRVETTYLPEDYLRKGAPLEGLRTRQIIKDGSVLSGVMVEKEPVIHQGDPVILTTVANTVRVSVSAIAKQDGHPGSSILVELTGRHQRFRAKVLDAKTVERLAR